MIETALINASSRCADRIFRRSLIERLIINCERVGIKRFYIQVPTAESDRVSGALGRFANDRHVSVVTSFEELMRGPFGVDPSEPCVRLTGNLVLSTSHMRKIIAQTNGRSGPVVSTLSADYEHGGSISTGPLAELVHADRERAAVMNTAAYLPFSLNGRPEDLDEAEDRLARALKEETADKDAPLARYIDRNVSWRISKWLAQTSVMPNQVTIANTMLGLAAAWMFASTSYWMRLAGAILFLASITIDGVDGELARLTMTESRFGGMLDMITDNVVHVALFVGIMVGLYRSSGSAAYVYLLPILLGGFAMCGIAIYLAFQAEGENAEKWMAQVDRVSGRDFGYLLVILALINRLGYFAWGAAFGTYIFAFVLLWMNHRRWGTHTDAPH